MGISEGLKRGTIEIMLLSLLIQRDMYGYDICREIEEKSNVLYVVTEGSLYPVLYVCLKKVILPTAVKGLVNAVRECTII